MSYASTNEKKSMIADLVELAKSDGVVTIPELTYLIWVSNKLEIDKTELMQLVNENRPSYRKVSLSHRLEQFHRMLNMISIDGTIEIEEIESCKGLAYQIGLDSTQVDAFMEEVKANPKTPIDLEMVKASFKV